MLLSSIIAGTEINHGKGGFGNHFFRGKTCPRATPIDLTSRCSERKLAVEFSRTSALDFASLRR
jgi:hypothetical protein